MRTHFLYRLGLVASLLAFACNAPFIGGAPAGGGGGLTALGPAAALLDPAQYADTARALAAAIAELNRSQELALEHLRSSPDPDTVDADLLQLGAGAMTVAQLAEQLAASTASQNGGDAAANQAAGPYLDAAQVGYLIVIETQNMRDEYKSGAISDQEVSNQIADQGGRLWSGDEFDPASNPHPFADSRSNPSSAPSASMLPADAADSMRNQLDDSTGKSTSLAGWAASSGGTPRMLTVSVPAPVSATGDVLDPASLGQMRTPEGQRDGDAVRAAASAKLAGLGATHERAANGGYDVAVSVPATTVFQSSFDGRAIPYFEDGKSSATATANQGGPLVSAVQVQDGKPVVEKPFEVTTATPLVSLQITDAVPATTGADSRGVALTVNWTSTLPNPAFTLVCTSGSGGSASTPVSGASGEAKLSLNFSLQRDTAVCQARLAETAPPVAESPAIALEGEGGAAPPPLPASQQPATQGGPAPAATDTEAAPEAPTATNPEPSATAEEARPPAGTSNWTIAFGTGTVDCIDATIPIESQPVTVTTNEAGDPMTIAGEGGSITMNRSGPSTYQGTIEQAVMTLTFTSSHHAEGDYTASAEGCTATWPVTLDRTD